MLRPMNYMRVISEQANILKMLFAGWDKQPRIDGGYQLPWPKYTRHDWKLLYTHFLYYPFTTVREFAEIYGLNYRSSQLWIRMIEVSGGAWRGNKRSWHLEVIETWDQDIIKMLIDPDKYVEPYKPLKVMGRKATS